MEEAGEGCEIGPAIAPSVNMAESSSTICRAYRFV
jgi:hypothetical protein